MVKRIVNEPVHAAAALEASAIACFKGECMLKYKVIQLVVTQYFFTGRVKDKKTLEHKPLPPPQAFFHISSTFFRILF